ncbi:MAG: transcriptional regulator, GntR family [Planctomycetaceae bacterium]|nr:transcriptional regulator, GntR family [Planctomycetaceae bacterium]
MAKTLEFKAPVFNVSLGDLVYQRLVNGLVSGQYKGGEEMNEVTLATQFQVSRTPIREALRRLSAEGFVVNQRNKHATVITMSRSDVIETYQVRQILESSAARLAAPIICGEQINELKKLAKNAAPLDAGKWGTDERHFDEALHRTIAESCGNEKLHREILRYSNLVRFVRSRVARSSNRLAQGHAEHLRILSALDARDGERAQTEMSNHIASALQFVLEDLQLPEEAP